MDAALIRTILQVGVPALISIADLFIGLAKSQGVDAPSIEDLKNRREQIRDLPDLVTYDGPEDNKDA